jgi:hypothetical protein
MHNFAGNLICTSIGVGYIIQTLFIVQNIWYSPNPIDELIFFKMVIAPPTSNLLYLYFCDPSTGMALGLPH